MSSYLHSIKQVRAVCFCTRGNNQGNIGVISKHDSIGLAGIIHAAGCDC